MIRERVRQWWCRRRGHDWRGVWLSRSKTADALVCRRCGANGWRF